MARLLQVSDTLVGQHRARKRDREAAHTSSQRLSLGAGHTLLPPLCTPTTAWDVSSMIRGPSFQRAAEETQDRLTG